MFAGSPLVLITTKGAKSGKERTTPIVYTTTGDSIVIIASKAGAPTSPDWFHNLVANPDVKVELANETFQAKARVAEEPERPATAGRSRQFRRGLPTFSSEESRGAAFESHFALGLAAIVR